MFNIWRMLKTPYAYHDYFWIDVILIKQTRKAMLIEFDGKQAWLPKAWVLNCWLTQGANNLTVLSIQISLYHWAKKFS
ncbi:hypothetical protein ACFL0T_06695 [Candidatus Omnitrophota bacterium]